MANFPAPPGRRVAYDRDDTQVFYYQTNDSGINEMSAADKNIINNEDDDYVSIATQIVFSWETDARRVLAFLFPQAVKLLNTRIIYDLVTMTGDVEWSDDTTNGQDGTWTQEAASIAMSELASGVRPEYRNNIVSIGAASAHKAWRFLFNPSGSSSYTYLRCVHLYAEEHGPVSRLSFWEPTIDQELGVDPDFEDSARGARYQETFRVKNVSVTQTANGITLSTEQGPSHGRPDTWALLSTDGVNYSTSISLDDLGPGTLSGLIYWRCTPPVNAELLTLSSRVTPTVTSWS